MKRFFRWCSAPAEARLFVRTEERAPGSAHAFPLASIGEGPAIFDHCRARGELVTLLLNRAESVEPALERLRARFKIPYVWREHDIVATLAVKDAGIGFHAGHEDGFVVQLRGRRRWRVWNSSVLDDRYRRRLLGDRSVDDVPPMRPSTRASLTCILEPGDALFIPALYGHEGTTLEESISLSIAWAGLTPFRVVNAVARALDPAVRQIMQEDPAEFFRLLPDPPPGTPDPAGFLLDALAPSIERLRPHGPPYDAFGRFLRLLTRPKA